jgi:archaellum component FlaC
MSNSLRLNRIFALVLAIGLLQAVLIGLVLRFGGELLDSHRSLIETTNSVEAGIQDVSSKADLISANISSVKSDLGSLDTKLGLVGSNVAGIKSQVEGIDQNTTAFINNPSGLVWGHSLNPYLLIFLLLLILVGTGYTSWVFFRTRAVSEKPAIGVNQSDDLSGSLDRLAQLMEHIRKEQKTGSGDLEMLMVQTEQLITEARSELECLSGLRSGSKSPNPELLH